MQSRASGLTLQGSGGPLGRKCAKMPMFCLNLTGKRRARDGVKGGWGKGKRGLAEVVGKEVEGGAWGAEGADVGGEGNAGGAGGIALEGLEVRQPKVGQKVAGGLFLLVGRNGGTRLDDEPVDGGQGVVGVVGEGLELVAAVVGVFEVGFDDGA